MNITCPKYLKELMHEAATKFAVMTEGSCTVIVRTSDGKKLEVTAKSE